MHGDMLKFKIAGSVSITYCLHVVNKIHLVDRRSCIHATWTPCPSRVVPEQNQSTKVKDVNREDLLILFSNHIFNILAGHNILIYYFQPTMVHAWPLYDAWTTCNLELFCRLDQSSELTPAQEFTTDTSNGDYGA
jgi:hypothetical protein